MIEQRLQSSVLTLTLRRPERRNAMNGDMVSRLLAILGAVRDDFAVRAIVLEGAGPGFCAGSDLHELAHLESTERASFEHQSGLLSRELMQCAIPVVAAVHGFAVGGGLTLAASCDVVVSETAVRWSLPEVPIGLFPAWGLGAVAARIGGPDTRRLSFGLDTWDGAKAVARGLADVLCEQNAAALAGDIATNLAKLPTQQVAAVKRYFADAAFFASRDRVANDHFMQMTQSIEARALFEDLRRKAHHPKN